MVLGYKQFEADMISDKRGSENQMKNGYAFYVNIHDLYILLNQKMEQIERKTGGLSYGQYRILRCISKGKGQRINQQQLVGETYLRRPTISQHLKGLNEKGYITHTMTKRDRRCKEISITEAGRTVLKKMDSAIDSELEQFLDNSQIDSCNQLLRRVREELAARS